jgi:hypothetical protein
MVDVIGPFLSRSRYRALPDTLELCQTRAQLQDLQTRYDSLCNTHMEAEQRRKADIQKWMELKTRLESDNAKLKAALRKEKAKTAAAEAGENARTGQADQHQQLDENERKHQSQGNSERTACRDRREGRTPLRTVGTPVKRVRNEQTTSPRNKGHGRDDSIDQRHAFNQGVVQGASLVPANPTKILPYENISRARHSSTKHEDPDGSRSRAGPNDGVHEVGSSSEKDRTVTEQILDTPAKTRGPGHFRQNPVQQAPAAVDLPDIEGSATESDEGMPLVRRATSHVKSAGLVSAPHLRSHDILDPGQFDSSRSGKQSSVPRAPDESKTITDPSLTARRDAANSVADTRKAVLSSSRAERSSSTRLDRTPSGLHWLGGDKTKISRRDSFEDEVGSSTRIQLKQEVTATLPRPTARRPDAGSHIGASSFRMPGDKQLRIGDTLDTPSRMSGTIAKRKREALPHAALIMSKGSGSTPRSDKKPRLTASELVGSVRSVRTLDD